MKRSILTWLLLLAACGNEDMEGNPLTDVEEAALDTCNEWLSTSMRGLLGTINSEEALFAENGPDQIDIAWVGDSSAGTGAVACSTTGDGRRIKGGNIDGVMVQP